jgi:hypothetical protein
MQNKTSTPVVKKFIVIYHVSPEAAKKMEKSSPEEQKKGMEAWHAWVEKCGDGLVDLGAPLGKAEKITRSGSTPSKSMVAGYSILQAGDMGAAKELLKDHPHLGWDATCSIEIHETLPMPE